YSPSATSDLFVELPVATETDGYEAHNPSLADPRASRWVSGTCLRPGRTVGYPTVQTLHDQRWLHLTGGHGHPVSGRPLVVGVLVWLRQQALRHRERRQRPRRCDRQTPGQF